MKRKIIVLALSAIRFALCGSAAAQQPSKIPKIGFLSSGSGAGGGSSGSHSGFVREFGNLGYVEGKNITFVFRKADTNYDQLLALAEELVRSKVDVIVTPGSNDTRAAKNATKSIPIVFTAPGPILLHSAWSTVCRDLEEMSRASPKFLLCWPARDWSC